MIEGLILLEENDDVLDRRFRRLRHGRNAGCAGKRGDEGKRATHLP